MFFLQLLASHLNNNITLLHLQRYNPLSRDHFCTCRGTIHSAETISAAAEIHFTQPKPFRLLQKYNSLSRNHFGCCRNTIHSVKTIPAGAEIQFTQPKPFPLLQRYNSPSRNHFCTCRRTIRSVENHFGCCRSKNHSAETTSALAELLMT